MRTKIAKRDNCITKKARASFFLFDSIKNNLSDYRNWLYSCGIESVETKIDYCDNEIVFKQQLLSENKPFEEKELLQDICKLNFGKFGIDANPSNFICHDKPYFVDFFPFLMRDKKVLTEQFDYGFKEICMRYFCLENILATFITRMFIIDPTRAVSSLIFVKERLIYGYERILDREKFRLFGALQLYRSRKIDEFPEFYRSTKRKNIINSIDSKKLKEKIEKLTL